MTQGIGPAKAGRHAALAALVAICHPTAAQSLTLGPDEIVGMDEFRGSEAARALLLQQRFVVAAGGGLGEQRGRPEPLRQLFSVYTDVELPAFLTPDLAIDAHTALLERLVIEVERLQAPRLLAFSRRLREVAATLDTAPGRSIAQLAAVAVALQSGDAAPADREIRRLLAALRASRPLYPGLDPVSADDLEPAGAYHADPGLARYFRARRFYQLLRPTQSRRGQDLRDAFTACLERDEGLSEGREALLGWTTELLGPPVADPLLPGAWTPMWEITERCQRERIAGGATTGMVMLVAGPLASPAGRRIWRAGGHAQDLAERIGAIDTPDSHFGRFLGALGLLQQPDPRAPALFRSEAWADLQANTQLGAWAQARHAWVLQAERIVYRLIPDTPAPPRVAPYPRFFAALARETAALHAFWHRTVLASGDRAAAQEDLRRKAALCETYAGRGYGTLTREQLDEAEGTFEFLEHLLGPEPDAPNPDWDTWVTKAVARARAACAAPPDQLPEPARRLLERFLLGQLGLDLQSLAAICGRLARIAELQLAGAPLGEGDAEFLAGIGLEVAKLHGYFAHAYRHPRDDHPRVTTLGHDAWGRQLQVGVSRPEPLYLVLEHEGRPTLYVGAVLSYREQLRRAPQSDAQWRQAVAEGRAPDPPGFTATFRR